MDYLVQLAASPTAWVALATLIVMEIVLGIDNLIFISILTNKLPEQHRAKARRIGISMALVLRLGLLSTIAFIVQLTTPVFEILGQAFSWKDMILIAGGLFLVWKATTEIHQSMDPEPEEKASSGNVVSIGFAAAIGQILMLDLVFSIDSIITAVGMTEHLPIMIVAVVTSVIVMLVAAEPLAKFIHDNPTVVMPGPGLPDHDRHDPDRRRLRRPCAKRLRVCGHGVLGGDRVLEHRPAQPPQAVAGRPPVIAATQKGRLCS